MEIYSLQHPKAYRNLTLIKYTFKTILFLLPTQIREFSNGIAQILYTKKGELWIANQTFIILFGLHVEI